MAQLPPEELIAYLESTTARPKRWKVTCIRFYPNDPDSNPVEDIGYRRNDLFEWVSCASRSASVRVLFELVTHQTNVQFPKYLKHGFVNSMDCWIPTCLFPTQHSIGCCYVEILKETFIIQKKVMLSWIGREMLCFTASILERWAVQKSEHTVAHLSSWRRMSLHLHTNQALNAFPYIFVSGGTRGKEWFASAVCV